MGDFDIPEDSKVFIDRAVDVLKVISDLAMEETASVHEVIFDFRTDNVTKIKLLSDIAKIDLESDFPVEDPEIFEIPKIENRLRNLRKSVGSDQDFRLYRNRIMGFKALKENETNGTRVVCQNQKEYYASVVRNLTLKSHESYLDMINAFEEEVIPEKILKRLSRLAIDYELPLDYFEEGGGHIKPEDLTNVPIPLVRFVKKQRLVILRLEQ